MWERTKRLINSYLDDLIHRTSNPGKDVRNITRAEIARLNELEVQAKASTKMLEKELAETELKMIAVSKREQIARERGDAVAASSAAGELVQLSQHCDFLKKQISEASQSAARAATLREERRRQGEELANETHLTSMREDLASIHSPFDPLDPAATLDEMRARIRPSAVPSTDARVAEADRKMQEAEARARVEEILTRYKGGGETHKSEPGPQPSQPSPPSAVPQPEQPAEENKTEERKTLGRNSGPVRPND
ncbi:MAG TPA: hypothetical protein VLD57_05240 [Blastocatellia bacterium]|nr:hypothetical protein [Blastocatellia bacterium]